VGIDSLVFQTRHNTKLQNVDAENEWKEERKKKGNE
jgi:hypothetical protein